MTKKEAERRIKLALTLLVRYKGIDGHHHQEYATDQVVRALTGCPMITVHRKKGERGATCDYDYETQGKSDEYLKLVADAKDGEDGPETYDWDEGVPP